MTNQSILVLGINGTIGSCVARSLLRHGWHLRALVRDRASAQARWGGAEIEWVEGDAMDRDCVVRAAEGAGTILHAVNPPGYRDWNRLVLPMIDNTIAAARAGSARIVLPGTIYNFDPADVPVIAENSPQAPRAEKGRIRVELERRLEAASASGPVLIVRAGDYIGADARSSWFAQSLVRPGKPVVRLLNPGQGIGHSWAYLPDLAEAFARLLAMPDRLRRFECVQFRGIWDADGTLLPSVIRQIVGRDVPGRAFPWWLMRLLSPFGGFPRAVREIEPYWRHPVRLDNRRLVELLGAEPHTPVETAIRDTLQSMGCLDPCAGPMPAPDYGTAARAISVSPA
jgi:nucleoside-diphosphate-sugar epimerase